MRGSDAPPAGTSAGIACGEARSDEQLVALVRLGHHAAFEMLAARYQRRLLWFCRGMLRSREDAEDALQDVLIAAFLAIVADDRELTVRPWLYRIARNRCIDHLQHTARIAAKLIDSQCPAGPPTVAETAVMREEFWELLGDLQALPARQRLALLLRAFDGRSYEQIATAMQTSVPGVKSLLVRARRGLAVARRCTPERPGVLPVPISSQARSTSAWACDARSYIPDPA